MAKVRFLRPDLTVDFSFRRGDSNPSCASSDSQSAGSWYPRWDSNPHILRSERSDSYQLVYRGKREGVLQSYTNPRIRWSRVPGPSGFSLYLSGALEEIRTPTVSLLRTVPLPIGLPERAWCFISFASSCVVHRAGFEPTLFLIRSQVAYPVGRTGAWCPVRESNSSASLRRAGSRSAGRDVQTEVACKRGSVRGRSFLWDGCHQPPQAPYPTVTHEQCTVCLGLLHVDSPVSPEHYLGSSLLRVSPGHPGPVVSWHAALGAPTFLWLARPATVAATSIWYPLRESNPCTSGVGRGLYH